MFAGGCPSFGAGRPVFAGGGLSLRGDRPMFVKLRSGEPLGQQIYQAFRRAILGGEMPPATRLPSTRTLGLELGVSRNVVLLAYEQLLAEGYAEGRLGSGTYVAGALPEPARAA